MPPAARIGDSTNHPGAIVGPGVATVMIAGQPAAVMSDTHACAFPQTPPHPSSTIVTGSTSVMIGKHPAARIGDVAGCGALIVSGAPTVIIGG